MKNLVKRILILVCVCFVIDLPLSVLGQDTVIVDSVEIVDEGPWFDTVARMMPIPFSSDENDLLQCYEVKQRILNDKGDTVLNGETVIANNLQRDVSDNSQGHHYRLAITYKENVLNGPLTLMYEFVYIDDTGTVVKDLFSLYGVYTDGIPNGKWRVVMSEEVNGVSSGEDRFVQVHFDGGTPKTINSPLGRIIIDSNNKIAGIIDVGSNKYKINNNYVTNYYYRRANELIMIDDWAVKAQIDTLMKQGLPDYNSLIDEGYILLADTIKPLDLFYRYLGQGYARFNHIDPNFPIVNDSYVYYTLQRINIYGGIDEAKSFYDAYPEKFEEVKANHYYVIGDNAIFLNSKVYQQLLEYARLHPYEPLQEDQFSYERWERQQYAIASRTLLNIVAVSKSKHVGSISFSRKDMDYMSTFDYQAVNTKNYKPYDQHLASFCPMLRFTIDSVIAGSNYESAVVVFSFDVDMGEGNGFGTYQTTMRLVGDKAVLSSFNFKDSKRIRNDWDQIKELQKVIADNHQRINTNAVKQYSDIGKVYDDQFESTELEINPDLKGSISRLEDFVEVQNDYMIILNQRKEIYKQETMIYNKLEREQKDVKKAFKKYFKKSNLTISGLRIIERLHYQTRIQDSLLTFINLRQQIDKNNNEILELSKKYKAIKKVYKNYYKMTERSWIPSVNASRNLYIIIDKQKQLIDALKSKDLSSVNSSVKNDKSISFNSLLYLIN